MWEPLAFIFFGALTFWGGVVVSVRRIETVIVEYGGFRHKGRRYAVSAVKLDREPPHLPELTKADIERAAYRAAVEAGYADLAGYVAKYGQKGGEPK